MTSLDWTAIPRFPRVQVTFGHNNPEENKGVGNHRNKEIEAPGRIVYKVGMEHRVSLVGGSKEDENMGDKIPSERSRHKAVLGAKRRGKEGVREVVYL